MANNKNGFEKQNAIINKFKRDARSNDKNSATSQAIKAGKKARAYREKMNAIKSEEVRCVFGSPAHLEAMAKAKALRESK